jgi:hypothetical protein
MTRLQRGNGIGRKGLGDTEPQAVDNIAKLLSLAPTKGIQSQANTYVKVRSVLLGAQFKIIVHLLPFARHPRRLDREREKFRDRVCVFEDLKSSENSICQK